ncbi:aldo/keto reductase [Alicyclobacillus fastidiosus]|uniref:Aldo/keto reductase n=1 Tax=Alicyclobacillus fastidiosus TaxID=392011 RepID=A0ABY6ZPU8_9BACL|nr:aldo/keto reductase [Alicyclobacillus fastidiosus]WAH43955.1 aldo/keto reductase [Alicyclobacillus fastidiosus]GMA60213.1 hypothetical protein GCM10025859_06530 [Alicyclobacillus fastidiosus]
MTYSSIAKGILYGVYHLGDEPRKLKEDDFRKVRRLFFPDHMEKETELVHAVKGVADIHNVMPSELAIAWLLHQAGVTSAIWYAEHRAFAAKYKGGRHPVGRRPNPSFG